MDPKDVIRKPIFPTAPTNVIIPHQKRIMMNVVATIDFEDALTKTVQSVPPEQAIDLLYRMRDIIDKLLDKMGERI